mmetsp:Transcript_35110/g.40573  ORF Transcript_35110/g.40573 Transcript_35110/m.40573 type:complete len:108 (-) Transcript_35110:42-365(-)
MDIVPTYAVIINYVILVVTWIYFRVFAFSYEVIWKGSMMGLWKIDYNSAHQLAFQILLLGLLTLNVYWTFLFFKMGYRMLTKGEVKDLQNPVEDRSTAKCKIAHKHH